MVPGKRFKAPRKARENIRNPASTQEIIKPTLGRIMGTGERCWKSLPKEVSAAVSLTEDKRIP